MASLASRTRHHLDEVEAALARWAAGTYGTCQTCGAPVPQARLEARPTARACVDCAGRT